MLNYAGDAGGAGNLVTLRCYAECDYYCKLIIFNAGSFSTRRISICRISNPKPNPNHIPKHIIPKLIPVPNPSPNPVVP